MSELLVRHSERVVVELQGLKKGHPMELPPTGRTPMHSIRKVAAFGFDSATPLGNNFNPSSTMIHSAIERSGARGRDFNQLSLTQTIGSGPLTPHGKQLLNQTIHHLNLPPEEWAMDVRDVYSQLVECLEQLYEREQELEDSKSALEAMETSLVAVRQQAAVLYLDYAQRCLKRYKVNHSLNNKILAKQIGVKNGRVQESSYRLSSRPCWRRETALNLSSSGLTKCLTCWITKTVAVLAAVMRPE